MTRWFVWGSTSNSYAQPAYYDYGTGGNVTYDNSTVYVNSQPVASTTEYAQSAATLATVEPPPSEDEAAKVEWLPLGTFAVSVNEKEVDTSRVIQLAVSKTGIISGTFYNSSTDKSQSVQGQVDKDTQRAAFRIGDSDKIVVETGIYNLTQQEASVLVHFGAEKQENWMLIRLEDPESSESATTN